MQEIEEDALVSGSYETNMESLDLNIRVLTELIQEQIQYYIYYESMNMEDLRGGIRNDVEQAIAITSGILLVILVGAFAVSRKIVTGITEPIGSCAMPQWLPGWRFQNPGGENRTGRD